MGTRGSIGFRIKERDMVVYNHFDSYPSGVGAEVVEFLRNPEWTPEKLGEAALGMEIVDTKKKPTAAQKKRCREAGTVNLGVSEQSEDDWYCLLRDAQGEMGTYLKVGMIPGGGDAFLADSLFCEYAYIFNLDTGMLEFYRGFNQKPGGPGRYAHLREKDHKGDDSEYYGVVLAAEFSLEFLRLNTVEEIVKLMNQAAEKAYSENRSPKFKPKRYGKESAMLSIAESVTGTMLAEKQ